MLDRTTRSENLRIGGHLRWLALHARGKVYLRLLNNKLAAQRDNLVLASLRRLQLNLSNTSRPGQESGEVKAVHAGSNERVPALDFGAGEGIRTLDPNLGKVVLYP